MQVDLDLDALQAQQSQPEIKVDLDLDAIMAQQSQSAPASNDVVAQYGSQAWKGKALPEGTELQELPQAPKNMDEIQRNWEGGEGFWGDYQYGLQESPVEGDIMLGATLGKAADLFVTKALPKIKELWGMRNIPTDVRAAIKSGDQDTLNRLIKEAEIAKKGGLGDTIYAESGQKGLKAKDLSSNTFEQRAFRDFEKRAKERMYPIAKDMTDRVFPQEAGATLKDAVMSKGKALKSEADEAYGFMKNLREDPQYDFGNLTQDLRDYMTREGLPETDVKTVLSILQPKKPLTEAEKALTKEYASLMRKKEMLERQIPNAGRKAGMYSNQLRSINRQLENLSKQLPENAPRRYSERDIVNISRQLSNKIFNPGGAVSTDPSSNVNRVVREVRRQFMDKAKQHVGATTKAPFMDQLEEANKKAAEVFKFRDSTPEIAKVFGGESPSRVASEVASNPIKLGEIAGKIGLDESQDLAEYAITKSMRANMEPRVGRLPGLDMSEQASQAKKVFGDTDTSRVLKDILPTDRMQELQALSNVSNKVAPLLEDLQSIPGWQDYILHGDGAFGKAGRALKTLWDAGGYLKNRTISKLPGMGWSSSQIKLSEKAIDAVADMARKSLKNPNYRPTPTEMKALEYLENIPNIVKGEATSAVFGGSDETQNYNSAVFQIKDAAKRK